MDRFDSRALSDTLEAVTVVPEIDDAATAFIEARAFFFLGTVNSEGQPHVLSGRPCVRATTSANSRERMHAVE